MPIGRPLAPPSRLGRRSEIVSSGKRGANKLGRPRLAQRARKVQSTRMSVAARRRETLPLGQPNSRSASRRRSDAGAPTAQPTGFTCGATRHAARPNPKVVPCHTAVFSIGTRYLPSAPAQPGIAADRCARAIVRFSKHGIMRSRQLNANPFGGFNHCLCDTESCLH